MFTTKIEIYPHSDGVHCGNCPYKIAEIQCSAFMDDVVVDELHDDELTNARVYTWISPAEGDYKAIRCRKCIEAEENQSFNHKKGD